MMTFYDNLAARLRSAGDWLWPLFLRIILWWEFWEAGRNKLSGSNWFSNIEDKFPFPMSLFSADTNWLLATWGELVFSVMLLLGLFTRFAAFSLLVITAVAIASVHWPADYASLAALWSEGYDISDSDGGNFKLPLLFIVMLLPLIFFGGGKFSVDYLLRNLTGRADYIHERIGGLSALGLGLLVLGVAVVLIVPLWGYLLLGAGLVALLLPQFVG